MIKNALKRFGAGKSSKFYAILLFVFAVFVLFPQQTLAAGCSVGLGFNAGECVHFVVASLGNIILAISAKAVLLTGILFNLAMKITVNLAAWIDNMPVVLETWRTIRDITSIAFIFVLLYNAFLQIFGKGNPKGVIVQIVIAGLLINFSFFIGRVMIDASNIVSVQFYKAMLPSENCPTCKGGDGLDGGISSSLMQALRVQTLYNETTQDPGYDKVGNAQKATLRPLWDIIINVYLGSLILFTVAGIFLMASLMFFARAAYAILLLALSPLAWVGRIIPGGGGSLGGKWMSNMTSICIAPITFLFLLYVGLKIVLSDTFTRTISGNAGDPTFVNAFAGSVGSIGIIAQYVIVLLILGAAAGASVAVGGEGNKLATMLAGKANDFTSWFKKNTSGRLRSGARATGAAAVNNFVKRPIGMAAARIVTPDEKKSSNFTKALSSKVKSLAARNKLAASALVAVNKVGKDLYTDPKKKAETAAVKTYEAQLKVIGVDPKETATQKAAVTTAKEEFKTANTEFETVKQELESHTEYKQYVTYKQEVDKLKIATNDKAAELRAVDQTADPAKYAAIQAEYTALKTQLDTNQTNLNNAAANVKALKRADGSDLYDTYLAKRADAEKARKNVEGKEKELKTAEKKASEKVTETFVESRRPGKIRTLWNHVAAGSDAKTEAVNIVASVREIEKVKEEKKKVDTEIKQAQKKVNDAEKKAKTMGSVQPLTTAEEQQLVDAKGQLAQKDAAVAKLRTDKDAEITAEEKLISNAQAEARTIRDELANDTEFFQLTGTDIPNQEALVAQIENNINTLDINDPDYTNKINQLTAQFNTENARLQTMRTRAAELDRNRRAKNARLQQLQAQIAASKLQALRDELRKINQEAGKDKDKDTLIKLIDRLTDRKKNAKGPTNAEMLDLNVQKAALEELMEKARKLQDRIDIANKRLEEEKKGKKKEGGGDKKEDKK